MNDKCAEKITQDIRNWLLNEEASYSLCRWIIQTAVKIGEHPDVALQRYFENTLIHDNETIKGMTRDILITAFAYADWQRITRSFFDDEENETLGL